MYVCTRFCKLLGNSLARNLEPFFTPQPTPPTLARHPCYSHKRGLHESTLPTKERQRESSIRDNTCFDYSQLIKIF